jgi:hypothetical protein
MFHRSSIGAAALAALLCMQVAGAWAQNASGPKESGAKDSGAKDAKAFPNWEGLWGRGSPVGAWDPTKPPGAGQQPPLTAEYQKVFESNLAKGKAGVVFDIKGTCGPVGMPRLMILYEPVEIIIKPKVTYMLFESMSPIRRIYTDGRDWPKESDPQFVGYSIGTWLDTDGDGTYDTLEVETRNMRGPRLFDSAGIPLHADNETVVKEKLYLDKANPDILHDEITTFDHALTRPWVVSRFYRREHNPIYEEYPCTEDNRWVAIGGELYLADSEGYLMPIQKNQPPPDPKYLEKYFKPKK